MNASPNPDAVVSLRNLGLAYGAKTVLKGLNFELPAGQVVGLLGRNGAGKTTLLETLLGLRDGASGEAWLFGERHSVLSDAQRARIGYVPQQSNMFEWMNADQLLSYFKSFYPRWNPAKVDGLLQRWNIDRLQPISKLSGGQQQRLSIIRALGHEPDLLILEEPVSSLDPAGRRDFLQELVAQVLDRGTTVLLSTHILSDLERVAFDVAFMAQGRIALQAPLAELMDETRSLVGTSTQVQQQLHMQGWETLAQTPMEQGRVRVLARHPEAAQLPAWAGNELNAVSLEELFLELAT